MVVYINENVYLFSHNNHVDDEEKNIDEKQIIY